MDEMGKFIKTLTEQIRCVKARDGVAHELSDHILDQAKAYEESGTSHDEAVQMAVHEMGDPVEIGVSLDRVHRPQMNWKMILITFILSVIGALVTICAYGWERWDDIAGRQCIFMAVGFMVIIVVNFVDYSVIGRFGHVAYILLTIAFFIGGHLLPRIYGRIPAMSMLVYLYVPLFAGILYRLRTGGYGAVVMGVVVIFMTTAFSIMFANNITVGANIYFILVVMMIAAVRNNMFRINKRWVTIIMIAIAFLPVACSAIYVCFMSPSFRTARILAFLHRDQYRATSGYIYAVIEEVLGSLRFIGKGEETGMYGDIAPYYDTVAYMDSSMAPLNFMHTYGIFAGILLLLFFAVFIVYAMRIVHSQKNQLGKIVSLSCFLVLFVNCLEGVLMNLGLFPASTVSIPFITRGGSVVLVHSVLIGLLLSVHRYEKVFVAERAIRHSKWRLRIKFEKT